jgi:dihydropteroate synthase
MAQKAAQAMAKEMAVSGASSAAPAGGSALAANVLRDLLENKRPLVMGVLNVTPDSFSDGGRFLDPAAAIAQAGRLAAEGADIIDIGAESTRPYGDAVAVPAEEERARLGPVLPAVVALGIAVSIDTMKAAVAAWALEAGAKIANDVWGLQRDPDMTRVIAEHAAPVIVMHNRDAADPKIDIIAEVTAFFRRSLDIADRAGILRDRIVLDPGIGFGKTPEQSMTCIARLDVWRGFGLPLLVGASRKRFIHAIAPSAPTERLGGSLAAHLLAVENGAAIIRTHDVAATVQALAVAAAIRRTR